MLNPTSGLRGKQRLPKPSGHVPYQRFRPASDDNRDARMPDYLSLPIQGNLSEDAAMV